MLLGSPRSSAAPAAASAATPALPKDVQWAFVRSASRLLPVAEDSLLPVVEDISSRMFQAVGLFEACGVVYASLGERYHSLPVWPWDAQVALLMMGWAAGPGFKLEKFQAAACRYAPDFQEMSHQCAFPHRGHTGAIVLGGMCRAGFAAAARSVEEGTSRKRLYSDW